MTRKSPVIAAQLSTREEHQVRDLRQRLAEAEATIQALLSGQVDLVGMSAFAAKSIADRNPDKKIENKFTVTTAFYAAAVKPGDNELLRFLNTWVWLRTSDGTLGEIYQKHTGVKLIPLPTF